MAIETIARGDIALAIAFCHHYRDTLAIASQFRGAGVAKMNPREHAQLYAAQNLRDNEAPIEPDKDAVLLSDWALELTITAERALDEIRRAEKEAAYGNFSVARALLENAMNTMRDAE